MNSSAPQPWYASFLSHLPGWIGGSAAMGIGCADLWHFHALDTVGDVGLLTAGLLAFGVSWLTQKA